MKQRPQPNGGDNSTRVSRDLFDLPVVRGRKYGHGQATRVSPNKDTGQDPPPATNELSDEERRFLKSVFEQPARPSSTYPKLAGISSRKAIRLRKQLVALGLLRETKVNTKPRGRPSILLEVTRRANDLLAKEDGG